MDSPLTWSQCLLAFSNLLVASCEGEEANNRTIEQENKRTREQEITRARDHESKRSREQENKKPRDQEIERMRQCKVGEKQNTRMRNSGSGRSGVDLTLGHSMV